MRIAGTTAMRCEGGVDADGAALVAGDDDGRGAAANGGGRGRGGGGCAIRRPGQLLINDLFGFVPSMRQSAIESLRQFGWFSTSDATTPLTIPPQTGTVAQCLMSARFGAFPTPFPAVPPPRFVAVLCSTARDANEPLVRREAGVVAEGDGDHQMYRLFD